MGNLKDVIIEQIILTYTKIINDKDHELYKKEITIQNLTEQIKRLKKEETEKKSHPEPSEIFVFVIPND